MPAERVAMRHVCEIRGGDLLRIDFDSEARSLTFFKDDENMPAYVMARMVDTSAVACPDTMSTGAAVEPPRFGHIAKTSNKR